MRVIFPLIKAVDSNLIVYPDDSSLFSNTDMIDEVTMVADYAGVLDLPPYVAPVVREPLSLFAFRDRFTMAEKRSIYTAAANHVDIRIWLDDLAAASAVDTTHPATIAGVQALEQHGLIEPGRADEILA